MNLLCRWLLIREGSCMDACLSSHLRMKGASALGPPYLDQALSVRHSVRLERCSICGAMWVFLYLAKSQSVMRARLSWPLGPEPLLIFVIICNCTTVEYADLPAGVGIEKILFCTIKDNHNVTALFIHGARPIFPDMQIYWLFTELYRNVNNYIHA